MARDQGYPYDHVAAALAAHRTRPLVFWKCLDALRAFDDADLQELAEQAKRMQRIAKEPAEKVDPALLAPDDKPLRDLCDKPAATVRAQMAENNLLAALTEVLAWAPVINTYFETVLVNEENEAVRRNRHALLRDVLAALTLPADFTQIEKRAVSSS